MNSWIKGKNPGQPDEWVHRGCSGFLVNVIRGRGYFPASRLHAKVRNQRNNFLHQLSTALIKNHDLVVGENLQSKNMLKNYALAMSISDTGWRTFIGMLEYKAPKYGRIFVKVNPKYTTQKCSHCGFRMGTNGTEKLTLKDRQWICPNCGTHHIRDWNAAKNILEKGYQQLAQPITADSLVYK